MITYTMQDQLNDSIQSLIDVIKESGNWQNFTPLSVLRAFTLYERLCNELCISISFEYDKKKNRIVRKGKIVLVNDYLKEIDSLIEKVNEKGGRLPYVH